MDAVPLGQRQRDHDGDTRACAEWLRDHLKGLGFEAQLVDIGGQPIVRASKKGKSPRRVMIYGHYDVQPEDPIDQWETPPFEPTVKGDTLYGRGATDDKGQVFTHVKAVESLIKTEGQLPCEVIFLLEGEEESGGDALGRYVKQARAELKPDAIVVSDTTMYDKNTPAITYGLRGIVAFEFTVKGPSTDVHSGAYGGAIANPAMVVAQILAQCVSREGKVLIPHFYDDVTPLEDWERESFRKLNFDEEGLARELASLACTASPASAPWSGSGPGPPSRSTASSAATRASDPRRSSLPPPRPSSVSDSSPTRTPTESGTWSSSISGPSARTPFAWSSRNSEPARRCCST